MISMGIESYCDLEQYEWYQNGCFYILKFVVVHLILYVHFYSCVELH